MAKSRKEFLTMRVSGAELDLLRVAADTLDVTRSDLLRAVAFRTALTVIEHGAREVDGVHPPVALQS